MRKTQPFKIHPNSLAAKASKDPELAEKIRVGRTKQSGDITAVENWANNDFQAAE